MTMGVTVSLPLFANPGQELEEGSRAEGRHLRELAAALQERLLAAADILDRLTAAGWEARVAMYDLILLHEGVNTQEEAARRLEALGVNPEALMIIEDIEEEEDEA
jgi:hypothetical protein